MIGNLLALNGYPLTPIDEATGRMRGSVAEHKMFYPAMKFDVYTSEGKKVYLDDSKTATKHIKIANFHKNGIIVFAITKWRSMFDKLEVMRQMTSSNRWVAFIKEECFWGMHGITMQDCIDELAQHNIDAYVITHWRDSVDILNTYPKQPIVIGRQSSDYIINICGNRQTYNKIPGYVYPAKYMIPHQYSTKTCSY